MHLRLLESRDFCNEYAIPKLSLQKQVDRLFDATRERIHNLSQPEWFDLRWPAYGENTTLEILHEIRRLKRTYDFAQQGRPKLMGGLLLGEWLERVKKFADDVLDGGGGEEGKMTLPSSPLRMVLYSAVRREFDFLLSTKNTGMFLYILMKWVIFL